MPDINTFNNLLKVMILIQSNLITLADSYKIKSQILYAVFMYQGIYSRLYSGIGEFFTCTWEAETTGGINSYVAFTFGLPFLFF